MKLAILYLNNLNISSVERPIQKQSSSYRKAILKVLMCEKWLVPVITGQGLIFATGCFLPLQATTEKISDCFGSN